MKNHPKLEPTSMSNPSKSHHKSVHKSITSGKCDHEASRNQKMETGSQKKIENGTRKREPKAPKPETGAQKLETGAQNPETGVIWTGNRNPEADLRTKPRGAGGPNIIRD